MEGVARMNPAPLAVLPGAEVVTMNFSLAPRSEDRFEEMMVAMPLVPRVKVPLRVNVEVVPVPLVNWMRPAL